MLVTCKCGGLWGAIIVAIVHTRREGAIAFGLLYVSSFFFFSLVLLSKIYLPAPKGELSLTCMCCRG